ncbi:MAG: tripartite tricarboxylate transporter TctB family protein [Deltaproteobacteria bacterium]|nr:tripartite tricarboxylate transporter TctB family protein [Deltaproteobacteria bacterium]
MKLDRICGIVLSVVGAGVFLTCLAYPIGTLKQPGGGFFPLLGAAVLLGLSLLLTVQSFIGREGQKGKDDKSEDAGFSFFPNREAPKRILFAFVALVGYRYLFPVIGFGPVTGIFIFVLGKFMGRFTWKTSILFGVITAVVSYYLFQVVLKVPMPVPMIHF